MTRTISRRTMVTTSGTTLVAAAPFLGRSAHAQEEDYEILTSVDGNWKPLRVINTDKMPWEATSLWFKKVLFLDNKTGSHFLLLYVPTGWEGGANHYHFWHEWAYILSGDLTNSDYASPDQKKGSLLQFREGYYLDRPPYSLHGAEPGRLPTQIGSTLIIMEEGPGSDSRTVVRNSPFFLEKSLDVDQWTTPRIVDTIRDMEWEDHATVEGLKIKPLTNDPGRGFRVTMKWLPRGWTSDRAPEFARAFYYGNSARQFCYILDGSMSLQAYASPDKKAEQVEVSKNFYVERGPKCVVGLPDGVVTETGCVWIETTYANGATVSDRPIEDPVFV